MIQKILPLLTCLVNLSIAAVSARNCLPRLELKNTKFGHNQGRNTRATKPSQTLKLYEIHIDKDPLKLLRNHILIMSYLKVKEGESK